MLLNSQSKAVTVFRIAKAGPSAKCGATSERRGVLWRQPPLEGVSKYSFMFVNRELVTVKRAKIFENSPDYIRLYIHTHFNMVVYFKNIKLDCSVISNVKGTTALTSSTREEPLITIKLIQKEPTNIG